MNPKKCDFPASSRGAFSSGAQTLRSEMGTKSLLRFLPGDVSSGAEAVQMGNSAHRRWHGISRLFGGFMTPEPHMESRNETNVALIVTDDELQVVNADSLSLEILGKSENQIVGTPLSRLLGGDIRLEVALLSTAMFRARFEEQVIHFHGRDLRVNAIPVTMETGDGAGLFITLENTPEATLAPETTLTPEPEPTLAPHK